MIYMWPGDDKLPFASKKATAYSQLAQSLPPGDCAKTSCDIGLSKADKRPTATVRRSLAKHHTPPFHQPPAQPAFGAPDISMSWRFIITPLSQLQFVGGFIFLSFLRNDIFILGV